MEEVQRLSLIQEVFGDQGSRVMNNILALEKDEIKNLIKEIENSGGFSKRLAKLLNDGLGGSFVQAYETNDRQAMEEALQAQHPDGKADCWYPA